MTVPIEPGLLEEVTALVVEAGEITLRWFGDRSLTIDRKGDGSPVTRADRAAEEFLRDQLAARFPDDAVVGEELPDREGTSGRTWTIDPIDGTESFIRGVPLYTNLLAMGDSDGPALGVVNVPALGEHVAAGRGVGCWAGGTPAQVSATTRLADACISSSAYETSWWPEEALTAVAGTGARIRTWGDGYGYVLLATGRIDAMVEPVLRRWDVAPMEVIVPEAGGRITTWRGTVWPAGSQSDSVLATNGLLHPSLLEILT